MRALARTLHDAGSIVQTQVNRPSGRPHRLRRPWPFVLIRTSAENVPGRKIGVLPEIEVGTVDLPPTCGPERITPPSMPDVHRPDVISNDHRGEVIIWPRAERGPSDPLRLTNVRRIENPATGSQNPPRPETRCRGQCVVRFRALARVLLLDARIDVILPEDSSVPAVHPRRPLPPSFPILPLEIDVPRTIPQITASPRRGPRAEPA